MDGSTARPSQLGMVIVNFYDQDMGKLLNSTHVQGARGQKIDRNIQQNIKDYQGKGYQLVADGIPAKAYYKESNDVRHYAVILKHDQVTIDADHEEPAVLARLKINKADYLRTCSMKVYFVAYTGAIMANAQRQTSTWKRRLIVDQVTSEILNPDSKWTTDKKEYQSVAVPVIQGFYANQAVVAGRKTINKDINLKVIYRPLGRIVPIDDQGHPLADAIQYQNDPTDPTKIRPNEAVPAISGYHPAQKTVTPTDPAKDTLIKYERNIQTVVIRYVDGFTNQTLHTDKVTGDAGTPIEYDATNRISTYLKKGYRLISNDLKADTKYGENYGHQRVFTVLLTHDQPKISADQPQNGGALINPDDPDGPTWPGGENYTQDFSLTINFINLNGQRLAKDLVQDSHWEREITVDKVTGEIVDPAARWQSAEEYYQTVDVPVVKGYFTNRKKLRRPRAIPFNMRHTIVYYPLGKVIPVDVNGQEFAGVDHPQYQNDPQDPTKAIIDDILPVIPGYVADISNAHLESLSDDLQIVYNKFDADQFTTAQPASSAAAQPTVASAAQPKPVAAVDQESDQEKNTRPVHKQADNSNQANASRGKAEVFPDDRKESKKQLSMKIKLDQPLSNVSSEDLVDGEDEPNVKQAVGFWGHLTRRLKRRP